MSYFVGECVNIVMAAAAFTPPDAVRIFAVVSFLIPVAYIWSLPHLATKNEFVVPYDENKYVFPSISAYITNAHATGAMAATFIPSMIMMWINALYNNFQLITIVALIVFQVGFSAFLMLNVDWKRNLHGGAVFVMSCGAAVHCYSMFKSAYENPLLAVVLAIGTIAFTIVVILAIFEPAFARKKHYFYLAEAIGLTALCSYVPIMMWSHAKGRRHTVNFITDSMAQVVRRIRGIKAK